MVMGEFEFRLVLTLGLCPKPAARSDLELKPGSSREVHRHTLIALRDLNERLGGASDGKPAGSAEFPNAASSSMAISIPSSGTATIGTGGAPVGTLS